MVVLYIFSASFVYERIRLYPCGECLVISDSIHWFRTLSIYQEADRLLRIGMIKINALKKQIVLII